MTEHETFWTLLQDAAHWEFELFLIFIFDVIVGIVLWPWLRDSLKKWTKHHISDDQKIEVLEKKVKKMEDILGIHDQANP